MPEDWRAKIQSGMAIAFLHKVVKGKVKDHPAQIANRIVAAKILLGKTLPDLAAVQVVKDAERTIEIITRME